MHHGIEVLKEILANSPAKPGTAMVTATASSQSGLNAEPIQRRHPDSQIQHGSADTSSVSGTPLPASHHISDMGLHTLSPAPSPTKTTTEAGCNVCRVLYMLWLVIIATSPVVGFWRSAVIGDEGKGFTDAAYIVVVEGLILFPVHNWHSN